MDKSITLLVDYCRQYERYGDSAGFAIWDVTGVSAAEVEAFKDEIKLKSQRIWNEYNFKERTSKFYDHLEKKEYSGDLLVFNRFGHYTD